MCAFFSAFFFFTHRYLEKNITINVAFTSQSQLTLGGPKDEEYAFPGRGGGRRGGDAVCTTLVGGQLVLEQD
jgi:hypothetical protein